MLESATLRATLGLDEIVGATAGRLVSSASGSAAPATGVSIDSRTVKPGEIFFAIRGPRFDGHAFVGEAIARGAGFVVIQDDGVDAAGVPVVRVADTALALADLARHVRLASGIPVVGITGSMGKTTTKEMTATMLEARGPVLRTEGNLNNQFGLPLSILRLADRDWAAVLEMGMSAAGEMRVLSDIARPDVAVITNVAPVHLEFFESVEAIAAAKAEILEGLPPSGAAVLNGDDPQLRRVGEAHGGRTIWFGKQRSFDVCAENWRGTTNGMRFDMRVGGEIVDVALAFAGAHFMHNFLAAAAAAHHLGLAPRDIGEAALHVQPGAHRGRILRLRGGVTLLDDCYNSNPQALEAAVGALGLQTGARRVAFVGDMLELGPRSARIHHETGSQLAGKLDVAIGVGEQAKAFLEGVRAGRGAKAETYAFESSAAAAHAANEIVRDGDAVLVKGSRGIRMEAIVNALVAQRGRNEG
jgi:UDP-N-acetylmuramoyl-tripeptide--D-alanyl-D-alanine ligase